MSSDVKTTTFSPAETESVGDKLGYGKDSKERLPWEHYLSQYQEVVFCGYGEPTERLEDLLEVARYLKEHHPNLPLRINTNGLSDLIWQKPTAPMLKGLIDTVSISLNAMDAQEYLRLTRSKFGIGSYDAMLKFAKECTQYVPHVVMTVVGEPVTTPEEQETCRKICESVGATLRVRPYES